MAKKNGLVKIDKNGGEFMAFKTDDLNVGELIQANIGDRQLTPWTLDTAVFPSGKGKPQWEIPTLEGSEYVEDITGIILLWKDGRVYYEKEFAEAGGGPPDCASDDLIVGVGNPGKYTKSDVEFASTINGGAKHKIGDPRNESMKCEACLNSQWGSARKGAGQSCSERRKIFLLQEGNLLPLFLNFPPTSLGALTKFFLRLTSKGKKYNSIVVKITLVKASNKSNIDYAEAAISYVRDLNEAELQGVESYTKSLTKLFG